MSVTAEAQTSIDEKVLESTELEAMLEDREAKKAKAAEARKAYASADELAKAELRERVDEGEVARVGRFVVRRTSVPSRSVSFDTDPTSRLSIGVVK